MRRSFFPITHQGEVIALIIRSFHQVDDVAFFTPEINPLQVGLQSRPKGHQVLPHVHTAQDIRITDVHEVFYLITGQVRLTMYDHANGVKIKSVILNAGDTAIHMGEGHGLEFLQDSLLFEVKQGPYSGVKTAKVYLK